MIEEIKILLGERANNYTEEQIGLMAKQSIAEVLSYTNRSLLDYELEVVAMKIAVIKLNRLYSEGLTSQSYSGVSESYIDGYPDDIMIILKRKRKIKVI